MADVHNALRTERDYWTWSNRSIQIIQIIQIILSFAFNPALRSFPPCSSFPFSVLRFHLRLRQCLYVVYDFLGAGNQVFAEFLEEGLAGAGLHM